MPTIEPVITRSAGAGFPNVIIDSDGVRRRVDLLQSYDGKIYGQLVFTPLMSVLGTPSVEVSKSKIIISGINSRYPDVPETIVIPRTGSGSMLINWPHADYFDSFSHISFGLILETNNLVTSLFRNIRIRDDWGYLDEYTGETPLASLALKLSEERRSAVYSSNRELLQKYSSGIDRFITEIETYLSDELEKDFFPGLKQDSHQEQ